MFRSILVDLFLHGCIAKDLLSTRSGNGVEQPKRVWQWQRREHHGRNHPVSV